MDATWLRGYLDAVNDAPTGLKRVIQLFMYLRTTPDDNHYAHPIDFTPVADLNLKKASLMQKELAGSIQRESHFSLNISECFLL